MLAGWWRYRAVRHGAFWATALAMNMLLQLPAYLLLHTPLYTWGLLLVQLPADLLTIYPLLYWLLPGLLRRRPLAMLGLAGWLVGSSMLVSLLSWQLDFVINPRLGVPVGFWYTLPDVLWRVRAGYFVLLVTAGAAVTIKVMGHWRQQWQLSQQLQERRLQAELQLLKAQLQPAFLFGTLDSLRVLTAQKSPDAPAAVLHLSALLRYMLYDSQLDTVPLADEVDMMRHYVALEQLRLGRQVEVSLNFSGPLGRQPIAPLLLLPFVENAFRHTAHAPHECPWLSLDLVARAHSLTFKVINSQAGSDTNLADEPAFASIRERLARLYPGRHQLKVLPEPDALLVALHLQLAPALPAAPPLPAPPQSHLITQP